jgi:tetratricopeptide (TPR) repeat protein
MKRISPLFVVMVGLIAGCNKGASPPNLPSNSNAPQDMPFDTNGIRAQSRKLIETTYRQELANVDKIADEQLRENAKRAANERQERRLEQIDDFLTSITKTIQSGDASPELIELIRIFQDQGGEEALRYVTGQKDRLIQRAKESRQNVRRDLSPLVEAVWIQSIQGKYGEAQKTCEEILDVEPEWPEVLYIHAKVVFRQNDASAEDRFRLLLRVDPAGQYAEWAKLWLSSWLMLTAREELKSDAASESADRKLTEALALFQDLSQSNSPDIQCQADIRIANVTLLRKKYDEMPALCNMIAERYRQRPEALIGLGMLYTSYMKAERTDLAIQTYERMKEAFSKMPADAFRGGIEERTLEYWRKWFELVER